MNESTRHTIINNAVVTFYQSKDAARAAYLEHQDIYQYREDVDEARALLYKALDYEWASGVVASEYDG